jgi:hypothetical protein
MDYPPPDNHQAIFESDVWNVFHSLGLRFSAFLINPVNGSTVWLMPPRNTKYAAYFKPESVMQELINKGFVQRQDQLPEQHPHMAEASYELTEEGKQLIDELLKMNFTDGQRAFVEKARPRKH